MSETAFLCCGCIFYSIVVIVVVVIVFAISVVFFGTNWRLGCCFLSCGIVLYPQNGSEEFIKQKEERIGGYFV